MICLKCDSEKRSDYPVCDSCAPLAHFTNRRDCRCDACNGKSAEVVTMTLPAEIKWIGNDVYAVSETVLLGRFEYCGLTVECSAYACRTRGEEYRYFGNYKLIAGERVISDQRGVDIDSAPHLAEIALRAAERAAATREREARAEYLAGRRAA